MSTYPIDIAFTPSVKSAQQQRGSREAYAKMEQRGGWQTEATAELRQFIAERDSFYFGTATKDGQPYIQHRGGRRVFSRSWTTILWRSPTMPETLNTSPSETSTRTTKRSSF